jgi:hypothetical protein
MFTKALITSSFIAAAMAFNNPLAIRQVDASMSSMMASASSAAAAASLCMIPSSVLAILETAPTPPADLVSSIEASPCHFTCSGSLSSECSSYTSAISSWAKANEAATSAFYATYTSTCSLPSGACSTSATGSGSAAASGTGSPSQGAAPQVTMMAAAVGAVAGAVGLLAAI